jgi:hypothetical protein
MRGRVMVLMVCCLGAVPAVGAQRVTLASLSRGDSVQVTAPLRLAGDVDAVFVAATADSVRLYLPDERMPIGLARSEVTRLRRRFDPSRGYAASTGFKWGAVLGGALGVASALSSAMIGGSSDRGGAEIAADLLLWTGGHALFGGMMGGAIGAAFQRTRWARVDLSPSLGSLSPQMVPVSLHRVGVRFTW